VTDDDAPASDDRIRALVRDGRHAEAAELLLAAGDPRRAADLFAEVWMYDRAVAAARTAGDLLAAIRFALDAGDRTLLDSLVRETSVGDVGRSIRAAETLAERGEAAQASRLFVSAGEDARGAEVLSAAGEHGAAAEILERAGHLRDAGIACEERLRTDPDDAETAVRLARILLGFGRAEPAARAALRAGPAHSDALRILVRAFAAMGHPVAARERLRDLRALDPDAPESLLEPPGTSAPDRPDPDDGRWLAGRYKIEKLLGGGSVGRVYRAKDALTDRQVAVKVFGASGAGASGRDAHARFVREARVASRIDHPNVIEVLEFNEDGPFIVMELCDGTLEDRLDARIPMATVRAVAQGVTSALAASHLRGIVHRDVKPANVFFSKGMVKLGDFGTAHLLELGQTQTGGFLGTLAYMAPEQVTGGKVDASTDLYAVAMVLYRCLTSEPVFRGADLVSAHLGERADPPSVRRPSLGTSYDAPILRALEKDPSGRFRSAGEMWAALEALPWSDPAEESSSLAAPPIAEPSSQPPDRWTVAADLGDGRARVVDTLLGRTALRVALSRGSTDVGVVRVLAAEADPAVQALLDADLDAATALLEWIPGPEVDDDAAVAAARTRLAARGLAISARARDTDGGPVLPVEELLAR